MKKTLVIGGLLLSCFMATNVQATQSAQEQSTASQVERRFFLSFLEDMRRPDDDRVHWADNRFENQKYDRKQQTEWNGRYELTPMQAHIILDRMADQFFLYREQKRQIYIILTQMHEPMYNHKEQGTSKRSEYVNYMKWKRREMDRKICQVLTEKQRKIYFTMKSDTAEFALRGRR